MSKPKVVVVTNIRSYHQVDLFDAVASLGEVNLRVFYLRSTSPGREWTSLPEPQHAHRMLPVYLSSSPLNINPTIVRDLHAERPDLVVVCQYSSISYQLAMAYLALRKVPWVFWSESPGVRFFEVRSRLPEWVRPVLRSLAFLPVAHFANEVWGIGARAQHTMNAMGAQETKHLPYYSDLKRFSRSNEPYAPDGKVRFLFAGRLSYRKGFDVVLKAFGRLTQDGRADWSLTVCGNGEYRELVRDQGFAADQVRYVGFKELHEMPTLMRSHDVFVAPSRYDGWGMVAPEALTAGLPVVTTNQMESAVCIGEHPPVLSFVAPGDDVELYRKLQWWLDNKTKLADDGTRATALASAYDARHGAKVFSTMAKRIVTESFLPRAETQPPS